MAKLTAVEQEIYNEKHGLNPDLSFNQILEYSEPNPAARVSKSKGSELVKARFTPEIKQALKAYAKQHHMSLSAACVELVTASLKNNQSQDGLHV